MHVIYFMVDGSGKPFYVGRTNNFKRRRRKWKYDSVHYPKYKHHYKIRKLLNSGVRMADVMVIAEEGLTLEQSTQREIDLIAELPDLCNLTTGGDGCSGFTDDMRRKISEKHTGMKRSDETRKRISEARKGAVFSDRHRENLSKARRKRVTTDETRQRLSQAFRGKINIKKYKVISPDGEKFITENGLTAFCREYGLSAPNMIKVANGTRPHHKGWKVERM